MDMVTQKGLDDPCLSKPGQITRTPLESLAGGHIQGRVWQTRKAGQQNLPMWKGKGQSEGEETSQDFQRNTKECQQLSCQLWNLRTFDHPRIKKDSKETRRRSARISMVYDKMLIVNNVGSEGKVHSDSEFAGTVCHGKILL